MALGLPYVISLHTHPKENRLKWSISLREKLINYTAITIENIAVRHADIVVPVYESIQSYLRSYKINDYEIIYNIVNPESIEVKYKYELNSPVKVISVGRLIPGKCPDNIIRSIKELEVEFDIVGDGPLRGYLQQVAKDLKIADRVNFIPSIPNDELCRRLGDYDIFAIHSGYHGVPKTVLEASLTGLPIIISKRKGGPVPEFEGDWLMLVDNSMEGYQRALEKLISNHDFRENLGRRAYTYAQQNWEPTKMENRYVEVYKRVMEEAGVQA
jgi:glycosyltransferase involved in cell wall biosynthesis